MKKKKPKNPKAKTLTLWERAEAKRLGMTQKQFMAHIQKEIDDFLAISKSKLTPSEREEIDKQFKAYEASDLYKSSHFVSPYWPPSFATNNPSSCIITISLIRRNWIRGGGDNRKWYKDAHAVAMEMRLTWLNSGVELKQVPTASNPDWPQEKDFIDLEQWFVDATIARAKYNADNMGQTDTPVKTPVTLDDFMQLFCTLLSPGLRHARKESLLSAARRNEISLPAVEGKWKSGQSKKYRPNELMKAWNTYRDHLPNLPELKSSKS